jgi:hypothetical protein
LVGENSTGKTSILALINLLNSPHFWFNNQFNIQDYEFGGFKDIISANATDSDLFSIGIIQKRKTKEQSAESWYGTFLTFKEKEGLPSLAYVARVESNRLLCLRANGETFTFYSKEQAADLSEKTVEQMFSLLEEPFSRNPDEYKELPKGLPFRTPLFPLLSLVEALADDKGESRRGFSFQMPPGIGQVVWLAPIRTRPRRTYDGYGKDFNPEGEHTPYELRKRLLQTDNAKAFRSSLERFGKSCRSF